MPELTWKPDLSGRKGSRYVMIADALGEDVANGRLKAGTKLPTHRALAEALGVTVGTVTRAYAEAERRHLVDATVGRGTFVRGVQKAAASRTAPSVHGALDGVSPPAQENRLPYPPGPLERPDAENLIDLSANYPDGTYLGSVVSEAMTALAGTTRLGLAAGYQAAAGHAYHRAAGVDWLSRFNIEASPEDLVVTNGCQGGMSITLDALARPGDTILVEDLTWPGIYTVAQQKGLHVMPVAQDGEGLCPDALAAAVERHHASVVYCIPTLQNPTNHTMSHARREAIASLAISQGLTVIEDDIYGFLSPDSPPPLVAYAPQNTVYVTSVSKCVAPGLRIGFVKAPQRLIPHLSAAQRGASIMAGSIAADMTAYLIESGHADRAADYQRQEAARRQEMAASILPTEAMMTDTTSFHVWLALPESWSSAQFVRAAARRSVAVTPGDAFSTNGEDPRCVRVCLCAEPDSGRLREGLHVLKDLLADTPVAAIPVV